MKKTTKLTDRQLALLRRLPDAEYKFPGDLESRCYVKLARLGYAAEKLFAVRYDEETKQTLHRPAYIRTPLGKAFAEHAPSKIP